MFDERDTGVLLEVGKLYRLNRQVYFKLMRRRSKEEEKEERTKPFPQIVAAFKKTPKEFLEPGHVLLYLGEELNEWLVPKSCFLDQQGRVVYPLSTPRIHEYLDMLDTQDVV